MKKISIVSSCYNEALNIDELYERTFKALEPYKDKYEFEYILADNCSTDDTELKLRELAAKDKRIKVILNSRNFGQVCSPCHAIMISDADAVISVGPQTYTGKAITPDSKVTYKGAVLKKDTDYTVSYKNNTKTGIATMTVTGKGNYKDSQEKKFRILFKDVPAEHSFSMPIYWALDTGITGGYTGAKEGLFGVSDNVQRGQVVMFLWRMAGKPEPDKSTQTFKDVPTSHSFYKAIQWASENGITAGYKDGNFGVTDPCTRGQIVTFLWRYEGKPGAKAGGKTFTDVPKSHSYYEPVMWASSYGITAGYSNGKFGVSDKCTRGQMATFLYRVAGKPGVDYLK